MSRSFDEILRAILTSRVYEVARETSLDPAQRLSRRIENTVWLKREDQQPVFSFKIRGAYNRMTRLTVLHFNLYHDRNLIVFNQVC